MEISYWQSRWRKGNTGWHMDEVFPLLKTYWSQLGLKSNASVLVSLCGKSLDIDWLAARGHRVIGVDVSKAALETVMVRQGETFHRTEKGSFDRFSSGNIELWCGNILKLQKSWLLPVDAVYDKAALMALPPEMRSNYASHLQQLLQPHSQIFLNSFEYVQQEMNGPPFAVFAEEIETLFGQRFEISLLHSRSLFEELTNFHRRGLKTFLDEKIYHLQPK